MICSRPSSMARIAAPRISWDRLLNRPEICRPPVPANRPAAFDVDAGVDECRRQSFGEVLQLVGHLVPASLAQAAARP
jgi:hypothetical protein